MGGVLDRIRQLAEDASEPVHGEGITRRQTGFDMGDAIRADDDRIVRSASPLNVEPQLATLRAAFLTPAADHYIRSHGDIPEIDAATHRVRISGRVAVPLDLSLADMQMRFPERSVMAVLQCAGNRRADLQKVEPTSGDPWAAGAIGNARWTGAALADVLRAAGLVAGDAGHVAFDGLDVADNGEAADAPFGVSIPLRKALEGDVLLAWAMNGVPLTREHGAPVRVVVPGYAGVRSVKWLAAIKVQDHPSEAFQQQHDYLLFPPTMRADTRDDARGTVINEMPLNSAICVPAPDADVSAGDVDISGYAIASDAEIARVDVSGDGGRTWTAATIETHGGGRWAWRFWTVTLPLRPGRHELVVRAWDTTGRTQPETADETWNFKGYLSTALHRVPVTVI